MNKIVETNQIYIENILSSIDLLNQWDKLEELAKEEHDDWEHGQFTLSERDCQQRSDVESHIHFLIQNSKIRGIKKEDLLEAGIPEDYLWAIS